MQKGEFQFKKPEARRRRPSLVCKEKLSDLDAVWNNANEMTSSSCFTGLTSQSVQQISRRQLQFPHHEQNEMSNKTTYGIMTSRFSGPKGLVMNSPNDEFLTDPMLDVVNQYERTIDSALSQAEEDASQENEGNTFSTSDDKYMHGLWQELNKAQPGMPLYHQPARQYRVKPSSDCEVPDICDAVERPASTATQLFNTMSFPSPPRQASHLSSSDDEEMPGSPLADVFILRDESTFMFDSDPGSDIDWESLTPPVPRSPSDHTVPDLEQSGRYSPPGYFSMYSSAGDRLNYRNHQSIDPFLDQSVPDFML